MPNLSVANKSLSERYISSYSYGYQGSMKDNQIYGASNAYTTEFRELDVRLGRWWAMDPITFPWLSPYQAMDDNPIMFNDPFGDDIKYTGNKAQQKEEKADVKYLRKHNSEFNKQFKQWKKDYKGLNNLYITRTNSAIDPTLDNVKPKTPDPTSKTYHTASYSGLEGAHQGTYTIYHATFKQSWNKDYVAPPGASSNTPEPFAAFAKNGFLKAIPGTWHADLGTEGLALTIGSDFIQKSSFTGTLKIDVLNNNEKKEGGTGIVDYGGTISVLSEPIYVKVPKNFLGFDNWKSAIYDYEHTLREWEKAIIPDKPLDYNDNVTYKPH